MTPTNDHTLVSNAHESLFTVLQRQDALGALIRAHFLIEARLQRLLDQHLPRAAELPPLSYRHKVRLAVALGMQSDIAPALLLLGQLRDEAVRFAETLLEDATVDQLFGVLAKVEREAVLAWRTQSDSFRSAPALQRFNIIADVVYARLAQAQVAAGSSPAAPPSTFDADEVVTFEWSAPEPVPRRARDFASKEALYSWLIVND
jgi:hypothetical protein